MNPAARTPRRRLSRMSLLLFLLTWAVVWSGGPAPARAQDEAATRQYNEACRLGRAGLTEQALAAFRKALEMGFDHLHFAARDPDLAPLHDDPAFQRLLAARHARLQLLAAELGQTLISGRWTEEFALTPAAGIDPGPQGQAGPHPRLRLRWRPEGLDFELRLAGRWAGIGESASPLPWNGGLALVLTLAVPDTGQPHESRGYFVFAFGLDKSTPAGGMYVDQLGWQQVLELSPDLKLDPREGTALMSGHIPWRALQPFHPLADPVLGFNAALRVPEGGGFRQAELFPDPRAFQPGSPVRRHVPLEFRRESSADQALVGKVNTSVSTEAPLELALTAVSEQTGSGMLALDFTDNQDRSVLSGGPLGGQVSLQQGVNSLLREADFSGLSPGLYTCRAEMVFPDGETAVWTTRVLHLAASWQDTFRTRIAALKESERPTPRYYLRTIVETLDTLFPRRDPGPIATTLDDLQRLLARAEQSGTILPPSGAMLLVYPGPDRQDRLCSLYLPEGYRERGPLNPVVIMAGMPGFEPRLGRRIGRWYETAGQLADTLRTTSRAPVYLLPHAPPAEPATSDGRLAETRAAVEWFADYFTADGFSVCGIDAYGGAALRLIQQEPRRSRALLVLAGGRLAPWPSATPAFLAEKLSPAPTSVPVTWLDFPAAASGGEGQSQMLLEVMRDVGYRLAERQSVRGGLSFSQAADRIVLWAESIP